MNKTDELMALADLLMEDAPLPPELCDCNTCKSAAVLREYAATMDQEPVAWAEAGVLNWIDGEQFKHKAALYTRSPKEPT